MWFFAGVSQPDLSSAVSVRTWDLLYEDAEESD